MLLLTGRREVLDMPMDTETLPTARQGVPDHIVCHYLLPLVQPILKFPHYRALTQARQRKDELIAQISISDLGSFERGSMSR